MDKKVLSLEEKKKASLDTLLFFHDYCEKNGLRYTLAYGTLIGAVRHKGFIPWDDDIDIQMPRPDYEKLLSGFVDTDEFKVISCENDKIYMFPYAKVLNRKTARLDGDGNQDSIGLGIDLFPLDGVPDDQIKAEKPSQADPLRRACDEMTEVFAKHPIVKKARVNNNENDACRRERKNQELGNP